MEETQLQMKLQPNQQLVGKGGNFPPLDPLKSCLFRNVLLKSMHLSKILGGWSVDINTDSFLCRRCLGEGESTTWTFLLVAFVGWL